MNRYHLTFNSAVGQWQLKLAGSQVPLNGWKTKDEAIHGSKAHIEANGGGSLRIHNQNGMFEEERTYIQPDPPQRKG